MTYREPLSTRELVRRLQADREYMWYASGGSGGGNTEVAPGPPPAGLPDPFAFTAYLAAPFSTLTISDPVVLAGSGSPWAFNCASGELSVNGGAFAAVGVASAGDSIRQRVASSAAPATLVNGSANVGGTIGLFPVTTVQQAATSALLLRIAVLPDQARRQLIDDCMNSLVAAGVLAKLDLFYMFAAADQQSALLNWKQALFDATLSPTAPAFQADRGFTGNAASAFIETGMNDNGGTNWQQLSASMYAYVNLAGSTAATAFVFGTQTSTIVRINPMTTGNFQTRIHTGTSQSNAQASRLGGSAASRDAANARLFRDGVFLVNVAAGAAALVADPLRFLAGSAGFCSDRVACGAVGGTLTDPDMAALHNAVATYLAAVGGA